MTDNTNPPMNKSIAEIDLRFAEAYVAGGSLKSIAAAHGQTALRVRDALIRTGTELRGRGYATASRLNAETRRMILALYDEGYRAEVIANKTDLPVARIGAILRQGGRRQRRTTQRVIPTEGAP